MNTSNLLSFHIKLFFSDYLKNQKNVTINTIKSYRDTFKLFIHFISSHYDNDPLHSFTISDLNPKLVLDFLSYLQHKQLGRGNSTQTRNTRLSALRSFCSYLYLSQPSYKKYVSKLLLIPIKKNYASLSPDYFDIHELSLLFKEIPTSSQDGFRDYCILYTSYNIGARASEITHLSLSSLSLENNYVKFIGKGNKPALIPLWTSTSNLLSTYIKKYRRKPKPSFEDFLFINQRGSSLSRVAIWKIFKKYILRASIKHPDLLKKKLSPHSIRHTTAVHMLESGVELNLIKSWLRHSDINTTSRYLQLNIESKRKILTQFVAPHYVNNSLNQTDPHIIDTKNISDWLNSL